MKEKNPEIDRFSSVGEVVEMEDRAKQSKTRRSRIEKCVPRILAGKGQRD